MKFFKVLLAGFFETKLRLPPHFCAKARGEFSEEAVVNTSLGRWKMDVERCEEMFYFHGAQWESFVKGHQLSVGNFIVFKHHGHMHFDASVFDESCCEKEFAVNFRVNTNGINFSDRNPTFKRTICATSGCDYKARRLSRLYLPVEIWKPNNLDKKEKAILTVAGSNRREWPAKLTFYGRTQLRLAISDGWWEFCTSNNIKEGDECTFEIMDTPDDVVIITVFK